MTNVAAVVRAAQQAIADHSVADWSDPDALSDGQLLALAGPGFGEYEVR